MVEITNAGVKDYGPANAVRDEYAGGAADSDATAPRPTRRQIRTVKVG